MHPLVRQPEQVTGVPRAHSTLRKAPHRGAGRILCLALKPIGILTSAYRFG
jgi:hypothetical protein